MIKVYVDTSVFGGCFDAEFKESVNLKYGYPLLELRSPREVLYER